MANEFSRSAGGLFTGERWEAYAELLFLRARYYEPGIGRFIQHDAWSGDSTKPMSQNSWLYVYANPVNLMDPTGFDPSCQTDPQECARKWGAKTCAHLRMLEILQETAPDRLEALCRLFEDDELLNMWGGVTGRTCHERLKWVLAATENEYSPRILQPALRAILPLQFIEEFQGDCCFAEQYRDGAFYSLKYGWDPTEVSNQVGHFLTAVGMTYNHWNIRFFIGHEQYDDHDVVRNNLSYSWVSDEDSDHWFEAVKYDERGMYQERDEELWAILHFDTMEPNDNYVDPDRQGNSLQDLRLSLKGYRFALWVRENRSTPPRNCGQWLRGNLKPYLPVVIKN